MKSARMLLIFAVGFAVISCNTDWWDDGYVNDGYDSGEVVAYEGGIGAGGTDGADMGAMMMPAAATPESAAQKSADRMQTRFTPAGCLQTTVTGPELKATFNKCAGPHGVVQATGEMKMVFSIAADGIHADIKAAGLKVNRYTLDVDSKLVRTVSGDIVTMKVTTKGTANGPHLRELTRDGSYTYTYDRTTECRTIEGAWKTGWKDQIWNTTVTGHKRCSTDCPQTGAKLEYQCAATGNTITISHDGSGSAKYEATGGKTGNFTLFCGDNI